MKKVYLDKVDTLLHIIPLVTEEECFAIHGGTAINLFINNLTRLSVDIDITYLPLEDRESSIQHINEALLRIASQVKSVLKDVHIIPRLDICKLTCEYRGHQIKLEVNQTKRGVIGGEILTMPLCEKAQELFVTYVEARIVPLTLLYGGKIAAALSRQHPRDLFDVQHMSLPLSNAKEGFLFNVLSSDRPIHETFAPNLIDQQQAIQNQFEGMSDIPFTYADFEKTRAQLIDNVNAMLTENEKKFLISFELGTPDWTLFDHPEYANYPSVQWKLLNLNKLKQDNPLKLQEEADKLKAILL